jgi:dihydropteroate synthase
MRAPPPWAGLPAKRALVMGVVNVTPDSFSDGGDYADTTIAVTAGVAMAEAGADILDVGGESTRPGSEAVSLAEEQRRVLPVARALVAAGPAVSVDTRNAATMAAALAAGARIINDVSALAHDPEAAGVLASSDCGVILMHMRGTPATMMAHAEYADPAVEVARELAERVAAAEAAGIERARIAVDPGIGFAKMRTHNVDVLRRLPLLLNLGCPILIGVSRKSLIGRITGAMEPKRRGPGSLAAGLFGLGRGARILRVHDVMETVQAVRVWEAFAHAADREELAR